MSVHVADERILALDGRFDVGRRQVLASRGDDEMLLTISDAQEALFIDVTDIAGVKPSADDGLGGGLGILVVTLEDQGPA